MRRFVVLMLLTLIVSAEGAGAAIITASGRRAATSGTAKVITTTSGQRKILITIDPGVALAFQLDVLYPTGLVMPTGFDGISPFLTDEGVEFVPPYGGQVGGGATIVPNFNGTKDSGGLINNIQGRYIFPPGFSPTPEPNRPDGGSDLFTLSFIDLAPDQDKVFKVLGLDEKGIDPTFEPFIEDNFIDIFVNDPNDPLFGRTIHISGQDIESAEIFVPGIGGTNPVPLPAAAWLGGVGGAAVLTWRRLTISRRRLTTIA